ncbi:MAG: HNH endonuclease [Oligoflexales bacterium]|nr:HNH endonuclease [Oligoflexales bacterium]
MFFSEDKKQAHIKREKEKARALRKSRWWHNRITKTSCHYCTKALEKSDVTMDHVLPVSRGGTSTKGNVVPSCKDCNNKKKNLTPVEWLEYLEGHLQKQ